jgi:hypothetical protein
MSLFGRKKRIQVQQKGPNSYFQRYYLTESIDNGIVLLAKASQNSKTRVVNDLLEDAVGHILSEAAGEHI